MTQAELAIIKAFERVIFYPGTSRKRFAKNMVEAAKNPEAKLTLAQRDYLVKLAIQFRRQIPKIEQLIGAILAENIALGPDEHRKKKVRERKARPSEEIGEILI